MPRENGLLSSGFGCCPGLGRRPGLGCRLGLGYRPGLGCRPDLSCRPGLRTLAGQLGCRSRDVVPAALAAILSALDGRAQVLADAA